MDVLIDEPTSILLINDADGLGRVLGDNVIEITLVETKKDHRNPIPPLLMSIASIRSIGRRS